MEGGGHFSYKLPSLNIPIGPVDSESVSLSSSQLSLLTHWRIFSNKPDYVPSHA